MVMQPKLQITEALPNPQQALTRLRQPYITGRTVTYSEPSAAAPCSSPWRYNSRFSRFTSLMLRFHTLPQLE